MRRALFFAPYFLPRRRVGAMRPFRFAIHLREFGWQPTVITIRTRGDSLTSREASLLEGIEIVEIAPPFDRSVGAESQLRTASAAPPAKKRAPSRLVEALDRQLPVDSWSLLFVMKYPWLLREVRRIAPDVICATGDPWSSLVVASRIAKRERIPFIADFRDPWTLCSVRSAGRLPVSRAIDASVERRVLERADWVLFQAEETEAAYRRHYSHLDLQTSTITNSFSRALMRGSTPLRDDQEPGLSDGQLSICFFGRFRAMSPASVVADALAEIRRRDPDRAERVFVYSFGPLNAYDSSYASRLGVADRFRSLPAVPLEQAVALLSRFDVLLLSTDVRRREIIPAKLFEYLPSGRPILSLSLNPEVGRILQRTRTGIQLDPREPAMVADLLVGMLRARELGGALPFPFVPDPDEIERYEARVTTRELAALFDSVASKSSV